MTERVEGIQTEKGKDKKIKITKRKNWNRQKDEKTEMFERVNCIYQLFLDHGEPSSMPLYKYILSTLLELTTHFWYFIVVLTV